MLEAARRSTAPSSWSDAVRRLTIPSMMMPSVTVCSFLTVANGFKLFDQSTWP